MALDLSNPRTLRAVMQSHGIRPRHRLGQNFLAEPQVLERICSAAQLSKDDLVLEIGPGLGTLTQALAERAGRVVAVELDRLLVSILQDTIVAFYPNVEIVQGDASRIDLAELLKQRLAPGQRAKVVANLPYYITTPLLLRLLEERLPLSHAVVMVQREVAERIVAPPGGKDYGSLSVAVQFHSIPQIAARVPRAAFVPAPEVDSAVVLLEMRESPPVDADERTFRGVVKAAFGQRRKTLLNALSAGLGLGKDLLAAALGAAGIDPGRRGETLSLQEFAVVASAVQAVQEVTKSGTESKEE